jgi:hypothetical protein
MPGLHLTPSGHPGLGCSPLPYGRGSVAERNRDREGADALYYAFEELAIICAIGK